MASVTHELSADPPPDAPRDLASAWPHVLRWGVSDDALRGEALHQATVDELTALIDVGCPLLTSINSFLDSTDDAEHAVPYGDLAQAILEAEFEVRRRSEQAH